MKKEKSIKTIPSEDKFVYKVYFRKNGCSILLFNKLLCHQALHRRKILKNLFKDWKGEFIVTK